MTKKRRNLRILASIIAAGCVWTAGMGNAWADVGTTEDGIRFEYNPDNFDNGLHGNSYEARVVLSASEDNDGNTSLAITLYRGDKISDNDQHLTHGIDYMKPDDAIYALGDTLYNPDYTYTMVTSEATAEFNQVLMQNVSQTIVADMKAMALAGESVWITGDGTTNDPYIINAADSAIKGIVHTGPSDYVNETYKGGVVSTTVTETRPKLDSNGHVVRNADGSIVYEDVAHTANFDISGYVGDVVKNEAGNAVVKVAGTETTIQNAINNNYNKIENVENNYVSNIVQKDEHTWKVVQGGQETVTINDTTLVEKRLMAGSVPNASANNALSYDFDPNTGIPQVFVEFEDTSGNVVQGAIDTGALMAMTVDTTDGNINVYRNGQGFGSYYALDPDISVSSVTAQEIIANTSVNVAETVKINSDGIQINNKKITGVADGEISPTSKDAINGSQLWQTNQSMDKLGGRLDKVGAGAAALAALHPLDFDPDDKLQFSAGVGNYRGETAAALGAFYRPTEKVMFSVAGTMGNGENMVNAGVTFALDRKNNVSNSRVAMAHEIKDLRDQVAALTALVSQIAGKGNPLLDTVMFPDVPENHWAYDYVEGLQKRGIIEGYPDGNFGGDRSMTRYEYAAMLYRALEKGFPVDGRLLKEFDAELGRIRIDRIKGADDDANKVERVRVNDYEDRDDYGSKLAQVVADAAPAIEEEPAA